MTAAQLPELSVLIASHNRRQLLQRCIESLSRQTQDPASFEVIVADDGSTDGTAEMAESFEAPFRLLVLRGEKAGKSVAVNTAIQAATGSACLFLDDDVIASPELVAEHLAAHRDEPRAIGIGSLTQEPPAARDWYAHAYANAWNERYRDLESKRPDWTDCYGGNLSAPRATLLKIKGFSTELTAVEDLDLGLRLVAAGGIPRYLPRAHGIHDDQKLRGRILGDTERFGSFCAQYVERHPSTRSKLLGWFLKSTVREVALRRALLTLRVSPLALAAVGRVLPGSGRRQVWFGFVSRYSFWLGVRRGMDRGRWLSTTAGLPVLMYHGFTANGERDRYVLAKRSFARQMRLLSWLRYRVVGLEDLALALREHRPLPRRAVAITIDDGYRDNIEIAHPILRARRFPATIFLVSARLGGENDWGDEGAVAGRPLLTAEQVKEMQAEGMRFGAHTRTHCRLPATADGAIDEEVGGSREELEQLLGEPVESFAYPYGALDERAVESAGRAGFLAACAVEPILASAGSEPLEIPRIEIRGGDSTLRFLRKLWLGGS